MGAGKRGNEDPDSENPPWKVEIGEIATIEFAAAILRYQLEPEGLGERFRLAVNELVQKISANPFLYQRLTRIHQRAVMRIFPYSIYYVIDKASRRIYILNIHHGKRHPKHWRRQRPLWRD